MVNYARQHNFNIKLCSSTSMEVVLVRQSFCCHSRQRQIEYYVEFRCVSRCETQKAVN